MTLRRRPRRVVRRMRRMPMRRRLTRRRPIHLFKRTFTPTPITVPTATGASGGFDFKLTDLNNYTEFTNLYDQYKIVSVRLEFQSPFTNNPMTNAGVVIPEMYTAIDRNDITAPAFRQDILEYETQRHSPLTRRHTRYFKVNCNTLLFDSNNVDTKGTKFGQWIDTADDQVPHFGLKYWIDGGAGADFDVSPTFTYYFQCRSVK